VISEPSLSWHVLETCLSKKRQVHSAILNFCFAVVDFLSK
jgi:hypothetical protein